MTKNTNTEKKLFCNLKNKWLNKTVKYESKKDTKQYIGNTDSV